MPNVAPRGLYGRHLGAWKNPPAIYARVGGVWKKVLFVWAMQNGTWQLIWGADIVAPASATAAWRSPHSVRVTIVAPAVNTSVNWIVRRSDGSIVATVPVTTLTVDDLTPLLTSSAVGNKTLAAYTVEGSDGTASSVKVSTGTVTWNLDPATVTTAVTYPTATAATVKVSWTPNATYGEPDAWRVWRSDGTWFPSTGQLAGSTRSYDATNQARGAVLNFRAVPFALNAAGAYVQAGNSANTPANSKAAAPTGVALTAPTSPPKTVRLDWVTPAGTRTNYEIQQSTNGTTWTATGCLTTPPGADYVSGVWKEGTVVIGQAPLEDGCITPNINQTRAYLNATVALYVRIRTTSAGGVSDWVQVGPKTPILDTTPPANPNIQSLWPESSYGRLVIRFKTPVDADFASYRTGWKYASEPSSAIRYTAWVAGNPNTNYAVVVGTFDAGDDIIACVGVRDDAGNINPGYCVGYNIKATPTIIDPSGDKSGTSRNGTWRADSVRSGAEIATGWSTSGHNIGCFFYGTQFNTILGGQDFLGTTIVSATVEYYRENEGGSSSGVQPLFWTHGLTARSGTPTPDNEGVAEASRLGTAVARTGTTGGTFTLPAAFLEAMKLSARGLCMYRGYQGSGDPDNYYALMGSGGVTGGSPSKVDGRVRVNHLG